MRIINLKLHLIKLKNVLEERHSLALDDAETSPLSEFDSIFGDSKFLSTLQQLNEYEFASEEINSLMIPWSRLSKDNKSEVAERSFKAFRRKLKGLISLVSGVVDLIDTFAPDDSTDQLNVMLPNDITLEELSDITRELDFIFNKCQAISYLNNKEEPIVRRFDSGSMWIILVYSASSIAVLGAFCQLAFGISKQILAHQEMIQRARTLKASATVVELLEEELAKILKKEFHTTAAEFIESNQIPIENGNEEINSTAIGLEKLVNLFFRGVEVTASLSAPQDVKDSFPPQEELRRLAKESLSLPSTEDSSK